MNLYLACLVIVLSVGTSVVWSNHRQLVSQAFGLLAFAVSTWIYLLWSLKTPWLGNPVPWLRGIAALGDLFPWLMWWMGRCAIYPQSSWRDFFSAGRFWMIASSALAALALSPWFIPTESTPSHRLYGVGYLPHQIGQVLLFLALPFAALPTIGKVHGFARAMAKLFYFGGGATASLTLVFTVVSPRLGHPEFARIAPVFASVFYVIAAWAISSQQLLDVRHHMLTVLRRTIGLICVAFALTWVLERNWVLPDELLTLIVAAIGILLVVVFDVTSAALLDRSLVKNSLRAARAVQEFAQGIAALPVVTLRETTAPRLADELNCRELAIYWRSHPERPLQLFSAHGVSADCPAQLRHDDAVIECSARERGPWWLARRLPVVDKSSPFALAVPVIEGECVVLLLLAGHKRGPLGFTQPEVAALAAWTLACQHTLTTRTLLERENAQRQLVYSGKLAAGIAHNLRNPIAVVRAYLEADRALDPSQLSELHEVALKETLRIQATVDGLAALSRGERFALEPHAVDALVTRAVEVNADYFAECRAAVEIFCAPGCPPVMAEPWQLVTALTNLLRNSAEEVARDGGGSIRIEAGPARSGWIEIRVQDSGRGLPAQIRDAVFSRDLFAQTTKPTAAPGRRTGFGVGLHSTMLIVTIGHGGEFHYRDGAFVLTLPAAPTSGPGRE